MRAENQIQSMSMSNLNESRARLTTFSTLSNSSFHPSSSQSNAIISTTTPSAQNDYSAFVASFQFKPTASFAGFIDRNSECTDLVGLVIACIIFLLAQTVLIAVWYYLYVKIKWQRRSLMAITEQRHKNIQGIDHGPHFPPTSIYGGFSSNPHRFPHHLLLPVTHQMQHHQQQQRILAQHSAPQTFLTPIEMSTQFESDQVYAPLTTIYGGTVVRHRMGSRVSTRRGFATASRVSAFGTKRRSDLRRTLKGNLRKSGGFHYYPNVFPSPTKLITSDSQDESGKSRVYEVFTASSGHEEEDVTSGQEHVSDVVRHKEKHVAENGEGRVANRGPGTRNNSHYGSKRNLFHHM